MIVLDQDRNVQNADAFQLATPDETVSVTATLKATGTDVAALRILADADRATIDVSGRLEGSGLRSAAIASLGDTLRVNIADGGEIQAEYPAIRTSGALTLVNDGSIIGDRGAISTQGRLVLVNYDTIRSNSAVVVEGLSADYIRNTGSILAPATGDLAIRLDRGNDTVLNAGQITGAVELGDGDDTYDGRQGRLTGVAFGGKGDDSLLGGRGSDSFAGEAGADRLTGFAGDDRLSGGDGDDILIGGLGADRLTGGGGTDIASYSGATAGVTASLGGNEINTGEAAGDIYSGIETLLGSSYADILYGDDAANLLAGGGGGDTLYGLAGDRLVGGTDDDAYYVGDGSVRITEAFGGGFDVVYASVNYTLTAGQAIEELRVDVRSAGITLTGNEFGNAIYAGGGDDTLSGAGGADNLFGDTGTDTLLGGDGVDTLDGGAGADGLFGGDGVDSASYQSAGGGVTADLFDPGFNAGDAAGDTFSSIENLIGSEYDDRLYGGGDPTANILAGRGGADLLDGAAGDVLLGGTGDDLYYVGDTSVKMYELSDQGYDTVLSAVNVYTLTAGQYIEELRGNFNGAFTLTGNEFANLIAGVDLADKLYGGGGGDILEGGGGADILDGGLGGDALDGGDGSDTASYVNAGAQVTASLSGQASNTGEAAGDTYDSIENLYGSRYDDILNGNGEANLIRGGAGDDVIRGGGGKDTLSGQEGEDAFVFHTGPKATNADRIMDFVSGEDEIRLDGGIYRTFGGATQVSTTQFQSNKTGVATTAEARLIYSESSGALYYDEDGNGAGAAALIATLVGAPALVAADFVII